MVKTKRVYNYQRSLPTFRCTRNQPYAAGTPLYHRQGYYIQAESDKKAIARMREMFPKDTKGFTAEIWQYLGDKAWNGSEK